MLMKHKHHYKKKGEQDTKYDYIGIKTRIDIMYHGVDNIIIFPDIFY